MRRLHGRSHGSHPTPRQTLRDQFHIARFSYTFKWLPTQQRTRTSLSTAGAEPQSVTVDRLEFQTRPETGEFTLRPCRSQNQSYRWMVGSSAWTAIITLSCHWIISKSDFLLKHDAEPEACRRICSFPLNTDARDNLNPTLKNWLISSQMYLWHVPLHGRRKPRHFKGRRMICSLKPRTVRTVYYLEPIFDLKQCSVRETQCMETEKRAVNSSN
jgi:hypothetical protein